MLVLFRLGAGTADAQHSKHGQGHCSWYYLSSSWVRRWQQSSRPSSCASMPTASRCTQDRAGGGSQAGSGNQLATDAAAGQIRGVFAVRSKLRIGGNMQQAQGGMDPPRRGDSQPCHSFSQSASIEPVAPGLPQAAKPLHQCLHPLPAAVPSPQATVSSNKGCIAARQGVGNAVAAHSGSC